jgi:tetratricopeptide (TPR) repeat protein
MEYYQENDFVKALDLAAENIELANEIGFYKGLSQAHANQGSVYMRQGIYPSALKSFLSANEIAKEKSLIKLHSRFLIKIGLVYYYLEKYDRAFSYYNEALTIASKYNFEKVKGDSYGNLAIISRINGNYDKSIQFYGLAKESFEKVLDVALKSNNKTEVDYAKLGIANCIGNMGVSFEFKNDFEKAISYYKQAVKLNNEIGSLYDMCIHLNNLVNVYTKNGKLAKAQSYLDSEKVILPNLNTADLYKDYYQSKATYDSAR